MARVRGGRPRRGRPGWPRPGRPSSRWGRRRRRRRRPGPRPPRRRGSRVASLSTSPSGSTTPQWPWSVYSSRQRSAMSTIRSPRRSRELGQGHLDDPVRGPGGRSLGRPWRSGTPKSTRPGTPSAASRLPSTTSEATVCWHGPGSEGSGPARSIPSRTNSGATRSSTVRVVSATSRRRAGVRRSRRSRRTGNRAPSSLPVGLLGVSTGPRLPAALPTGWPAGPSLRSLMGVGSVCPIGRTGPNL